MTQNSCVWSSKKVLLFGSGVTWTWVGGQSHQAGGSTRPVLQPAGDGDWPCSQAGAHFSDWRISQALWCLMPKYSSREPHVSWSVLNGLENQPTVCLHWVLTRQEMTSSLHPLSSLFVQTFILPGSGAVRCSFLLSSCLWGMVGV